MVVVKRDMEHLDGQAATLIRLKFKKDLKADELLYLFIVIYDLFKNNHYGY